MSVNRIEQDWHTVEVFSPHRGSWTPSLVFNGDNAQADATKAMETFSEHERGKKFRIVRRTHTVIDTEDVISELSKA